MKIYFTLISFAALLFFSLINKQSKPHFEIKRSAFFCDKKFKKNLAFQKKFPRLGANIEKTRKPNFLIQTKGTPTITYQCKLTCYNSFQGTQKFLLKSFFKQLLTSFPIRKNMTINFFESTFCICYPPPPGKFSKIVS